jgi:carbamate kinase
VAKTALIALGGNAILQPGEFGTCEQQVANIRRACDQIAQVAAAGWRVVLVHGNGPQVGNLLLQHDAAKDQVPAQPLDVCGAQSQGQLGYLIQRELRAALAAAGVEMPVAAVVTQTLVDPLDPAFANPTKPVGPFYSEQEARLLTDKGWVMKEDAGRGWRRVVPSPKPRGIVELPAIKALVDAGVLVIACGGGGVPVAAVGEAAALRGVEAVIDKDLAAQVLAMELGLDVLVILTDVPQVYIHYGKPQQQALSQVDAEQMKVYLAEGHFPPGSMKAKVEGAIQFVEAGGERAVIASLGEAAAAVLGKAGTQITAARVGSAGGA